MSKLHLPPYKKKRLSNGLTVFLMNYPKHPIVHFRFFLKKGSASDFQDKEGLAKITALLLKKGTKNFSALQLFDEIDLLGGNIDTTANHDYSLVLGEFLSKNWEKGLELYSEIIMQPVFDRLEVERQKKKVLGEIIARKDNPSTIASLHFSRFLFKNHPYGRPSSGTESSVQKITADDIQNFYRTHYSPENAFLIAAGDFDEEKLLRNLDSGLADWKAESRNTQADMNLAEISGINILVVDKDDASQTQIRLGNYGIKRNSEDFYTTRVLGNILGGGFNSRLNNEVRVKRGLTYGIVSRFNTFLHTGEFAVTTFTKNETVREAIDIIFSELNKIKKESVSKKELDGAKKYISGLFPLSMETIESMARHITDCEFYGLDKDYVENYSRNIMDVGIEDVKRTAQKYIDTENLVITAVGRMKDIKDGLEKLGNVSYKKYTDEV
ncbi:M16 family metallopeptidase [candidate division KSB1 bacterium]